MRIVWFTAIKKTPHLPGAEFFWPQTPVLRKTIPYRRRQYNSSILSIPCRIGIHIGSSKPSEHNKAAHSGGLVKDFIP